MTSFVTFAETRMGPVAIKRAVGVRLDALRRESEVLMALRSSEIPAPEHLLYFEMSNEQEGEGWLVMRRLPGEPLLNILHAIEPGSARAQLIGSLGQLVARLHTAPIPAVLAQSQAEWLNGMLSLAETSLPLGLWEGTPEQIETLKQQRPAPVRPALIHGDLFLDNVIADGLEATGFIDWSFGAAGDPRYDLALAMDELTPGDREIFLAAYGLSSGLTAAQTEYFMQLASFC